MLGCFWEILDCCHREFKAKAIVTSLYISTRTTTPLDGGRRLCPVSQSVRYPLAHAQVLGHVCSTTTHRVAHLNRIAERRQ